MHFAFNIPYRRITLQIKLEDRSAKSIDMERTAKAQVALKELEKTINCNQERFFLSR